MKPMCPEAVAAASMLTNSALPEPTRSLPSETQCLEVAWFSDPDGYDPQDQFETDTSHYPDNFDSFERFADNDNPVDERGGIKVLPLLQDEMFPWELDDDVSIETSTSPAMEQSYQHPDHITGRQMFAAWDAINFANQKGCLMNVELSISFVVLGCRTDDDCRGAFAKFLDRLRHRIRSTGGVPMYWFVWENARDRGPHVHMQLHLRPLDMLGFRDWLNGTLRKLKDAPKSKPFRLVLRHKATVASQSAWARYMLKGFPKGMHRAGTTHNRSDEAIDALLGIKVRPCGVIPWGRVGIAHSLNKKARAEGGYVFPPGYEPFSYSCFWSDWSYRQSLKRQDEDAAADTIAELLRMLEPSRHL